jgi:5-methylcytosine-specific restriction enzyme A
MESYVHKKEVDLSLLTEGLTLPLDTQVIFGRYMDKFLSRGEAKEITLVLLGKSFKAKISNVNFDRDKYKRKDVLQIRYKRNGELAQALQKIFIKSANYIFESRQTTKPDVRKRIIVPEELKEYLAIYTTIYEDTYILDPICATDIDELRAIASVKTERFIETGFNFDDADETAEMIEIVGVKKYVS